MISLSVFCVTRVASIAATLLTTGSTAASTLSRPSVTGMPLFFPPIKLSINEFSLKPLDIEFMKQLHNKVNIVPVIAKADVLTKKEVLRLKKKIMEEIEANGIKIYPLPDCDSDEDDDYKEQVQEDYFNMLI
jgi:Septin